MKRLIFSLVLVALLSSGCLEKRACRVSGDCEGRAHANCSSDWMCVDGGCVWGCGVCSLSLCDCGCYPTGETPEKKSGVLCGINCLMEKNVSGCEFRGGECAVVYSKPPEAECSSEEACVPGECCHPTSCVPASDAPNCSDVPCTKDCRSGTMDCGQGKCVCKDGSCGVEWAKPEDSCSSDGDCVPAQCCHPTSCVLGADAPDCSGKMCTEECRGGTMDCGAGKCVCREGKCGVEWATKTTTTIIVECSSDADCVPNECCHPTSCISKEKSGVCNMMCTAVCEPGSLDCGQGKCVCKDGSCGVEWATG